MMPSPLRPWAGLFVLPAIVLLLAVLALVAAVTLAPGLESESPEAVPPGVWATDVDARHLEGWRVGAEVPSDPFPGQKVPPCAPRREREIQGGCWIPHAEKAPCPEGTYQHRGGCYVPVLAAQRPPTSMER